MYYILSVIYVITLFIYIEIYTCIQIPCIIIPLIFFILAMYTINIAIKH